ncbi:MAG: phage integrase N-terminal domain-containing protein [Cellvibrionaceae bacterium]
MKSLSYSLQELCKRNRDGGFSTQKKRERLLVLIAKQLKALGYRKMTPHSLKPKHVESLVAYWQSQELKVSTIKSRMSALRWWAAKVNKHNVIARSNAHYGISNREYKSNISKARDITEEQIKSIGDPRIEASLKLIKAFGLRKAEAIKIIPMLADKGDRLFLKSSWCKGGRERTIPILTDYQRQALEEAKQVAGNGSLIPPNKKFSQQRDRYDYLIRKAGLRNLHGVRHQYAQQRYKTLTGWECPQRGGPHRKELTGERKNVDIRARITISNELGHNRIEIVETYLGA